MQQFQSPETVVKPRVKAGRPNMFKFQTERAEGTKGEGDEIPKQTTRKKSNIISRNKEKVHRSTWKGMMLMMRCKTHQEEKGAGLETKCKNHDTK